MNWFWSYIWKRTWAHSKGHYTGNLKLDVNLKVRQKCKAVANAQNLRKNMSSLVHIHQQMKTTLTMPKVHELI